MLEVELDTFSGMPNPTWVLTPEEERTLLDRVMANPALMRPVDASTGELGYRGMIIRLLKEDDSAWASARLSSNPSLPSSFRIGGPQTEELDAQHWLLDTSETLDTEVDDYLRAYVDGSLQLLSQPQPVEELSETGLDEDPLVDIQADLTESETQGDDASADLAGEDTLHPAGRAMVCGSNWLTGTNMSFWNGSLYVRRNNCYNFAANHRTNTFAQPGRRADRLFRSMSYQHMAAALAADGWQHTCRARRNLSIVLVIWSSGGRFRDFHFYRVVRRTGGTIWGHKPGQTAARITDASGRVITNIERANRRPYNLFYGYWYQDNQTALVR